MRFPEHIPALYLFMYSISQC